MHAVIGIIGAIVLIISGFVIVETSIKELKGHRPIAYIVPIGGGLLLSALGTISLLQYCLRIH